MWLPFFLLFASVLTLWALASPLASAADEPTTVIRAAAAVRGQLVGTPVGPNVADYGVRTVVKIPETFHDIDACFSFHPTEAASCARPVSASRTLATVSTVVGRYPPLYYLVVGLPSYLPGGASAVYLMRMAAICLNAAFLALAIYAIRRWSRSRAIILGFAFAVSPMVLFYSAVVNPSGLELCSAVCLWTTATIWAVDYRRGPPTGLAWAATVSAAILIQARPASLIWPVMVGIVLAPLVWKSRPRQFIATKLAILRRRQVWPMLLVLTASWSFAVVWLVVVHSFRMVGGNFPAPGTPVETLAKQSIEYMPSYLEQAVGVMGWLDTTLPSGLVHFWYLGVILLLVAGLASSTMGGRLSLLLVMLLSFAVPTVGTVADVHQHGFSSQGRYFLPVFVGMPIVAAALIGRWRADGHLHLHPTIARALIPLGLALVAIAQVVAFGTALRRYLVGTNGPIWPTTPFPGAWRPPLSGIWLDVLALVAVAALYWFLGRSPRPAPATRSVTAVPAPAGAPAAPRNERTAG